MKLRLSPWAALLGWMCAGSGVFAAAVPLSSLDLTLSPAGEGAKANHEISRGPFSIHAKKFGDGIGAHAPSRFQVHLDGNGKRFTAKVGVDDAAGNSGSAEFIVSGDGKTLWRSGTLRGGENAKSVDVDLAGVNVLTLRMADGGDGEGAERADWADAKIQMKKDAPLPTALPPNEEFSVQTKNLTIGFLVGDDGRLYQRPLRGHFDAGKHRRDDESYPQACDGYVGEPALQATHSDGNTSTALVYDRVTQTNGPDDTVVTRVDLHDSAYPFQVTLCFRAHPAEDVVEEWAEIRHHEGGVVKLKRMASTSLLLPGDVYLTHFFGDWAKEMLNPVTEQITPGIKVLDSKLGTRASQFGNPSFILSLHHQATETNGDVLAGSLAWSGSYQLAFDDNGDHVRALCGINPFDSAYYLKPGETFATPTMIWVWSGHGLGEMSRKMHAWARDFGMRDGHKMRAVLLNNWEATGFDFDFNRIASLFAPAREIGTELFLLDDGWFGNKYPRVNDHAGLGDWQPNRARLPNGLAPLAAAAVKAGIRFGIWMEPEMVNPQSDLFHEHPDWVIRQPHRPLDLQRNQLVLDLTRPAVQRFEWNVIKSILSVPDITYAKWDCNRYVTQPGSSYLPANRQEELWIDYVHALYALMDKTAATFPDTELMLCSGGGGRADYGALKYFQEFWPSDNTDPTARVLMQWDYSYFFPLMALASHVTHWGNRPMHFACSVAMSARFGMDLDLTKLPPRDKAICAGAIQAYKQIRDVTTLGDLYRVEDPHRHFRGALDFVSPDRTRAVLFAFQLQEGANAPVHPQGLDPSGNYTLHELNPAPGRPAMEQEGKTLTGEELMRDGLVPSCSKALEASVIELRSS